MRRGTGPISGGIALVEFVRVASTGDVPEGGALRVEVRGRRIALFNVEGRVYAIDDVCSHAEASLSEGELDGYRVACPLHGAQFDVRTGRALTLPAIRPVESFQVKVEGDEIQVFV